MKGWLGASNPAGWMFLPAAAGQQELANELQLASRAQLALLHWLQLPLGKKEKRCKPVLSEP